MDCPPPPVEYVIEKTVSEIKDSKYGYIVFDLPISIEFQNTMKSIQVNEFIDFNQVGNLQHLVSSLSEFLRFIGDNSPQLCDKAAHYVETLVASVVKGANKETAWVGVRASYNTNYYDIPRWHQDGYYYTPARHNPLNLKFIMTLKGPSTRFYPADVRDPKVKSLFISSRRNRKNQAKLFPYKNAVVPSNTQGAIFILGDKNRTPIHSEPPIHEERLFLAIIPCNRKDLPSLQKSINTLYKNNISRTHK